MDPSAHGDELLFEAAGLDDTDRLGKVLARELPDGTVVALSGTLGAGKTRLVQAVAVGCDVAPEDVVSPTFVLCQQYHGRRQLLHLDTYRLQDEDEFLELGVDEHFEAAREIIFIEWAERVARCLPDDYIEILVEVTGTDSRTFRIRAHGTRLQPVIRELRRRLS